MTDADRQPDDFDVWAKCDHDYRRDGKTFPTLVYICTKCGDDYERDIS